VKLAAAIRADWEFWEETARVKSDSPADPLFLLGRERGRKNREHDGQEDRKQVNAWGSQKGRVCILANTRSQRGEAIGTHPLGRKAGNREIDAENGRSLSAQKKKKRHSASIRCDGRRKWVRP